MSEQRKPRVFFKAARKYPESEDAHIEVVGPSNNNSNNYPIQISPVTSHSSHNNNDSNNDEKIAQQGDCNSTTVPATDVGNTQYFAWCFDVYQQWVQGVRLTNVLIELGDAANATSLLQDQLISIQNIIRNKSLCVEGIHFFSSEEDTNDLVKLYKQLVVSSKCLIQPPNKFYHYRYAYSALIRNGVPLIKYNIITDLRNVPCLVEAQGIVVSDTGNVEAALYPEMSKYFVSQAIFNEIISKDRTWIVLNGVTIDNVTLLRSNQEFHFYLLVRLYDCYRIRQLYPECAYQWKQYTRETFQKIQSLTMFKNKSVYALLMAYFATMLTNPSNAEMISDSIFQIMVGGDLLVSPYPVHMPFLYL